jgi:pyocin large subunit-like protein
MKPVASSILPFFGAGFMALALTACGSKTSAVAAHGGSGASVPSMGGSQASSSASADAGGPRAKDPRDLPVPQINGKPMWAANRKHTAEENAEYQFSKHGDEFAAKSETDFVTKVHAFIEKPPRDVQVIDRANGDKLLYDPGGNVFAVVSRTGAPRTMFKPTTGAAYWAEQKDREAGRGKGGSEGGSEQS